MISTIHRVKQFIKGLTAFSLKDSTLVDEYLSDQEKELFIKLPAHERRHAIDTAKTIIGFDIRENKDTLIKAALLHDIGKVGSRIGLIKKSILVLMDKFLPKVSHILSNKSKMFYVYYNHPEIGAECLLKINTEKGIILLVRYHHSQKNVDIYGIDMLRKADSLN